MKAFERIWISVNFHENPIFEMFSKILKIENLKIFIFHFPSNFEVLYLCEFLSYDNDQIMKKYLFWLKNMIFIFLLARAHFRARHTPS